MKKAVALLPKKSKYQSMFLETLAFYQMSAGQFEGSVKNYKKFFASKKVLDEENEIRTNISYAYSLGKSGEKKQATKILNSIISKLENSKPRKATHYELLDFEPLRQEALMWGLLAEYSSEPKRKIMYLSYRLNALEESKARVSALKTESKNLVMAKITDYQRIASSYDVMKKHHRAAETLLTD